MLEDSEAERYGQRDLMPVRVVASLHCMIWGGLLPLRRVRCPKHCKAPKTLNLEGNAVNKLMLILGPHQTLGTLHACMHVLDSCCPLLHVSCLDFVREAKYNNCLDLTAVTGDCRVPYATGVFGNWK